MDAESGKTPMIFEPILEEGVFRFDCSADCRNKAFPSFSFADPKDRETPFIPSVHKQPLHVPTFELVTGQQIVRVELPSGTSFYGTGEVSGQLERTGKRIFTWNTDAWGYGRGITSLYQSHPWVLAVFSNGEALGILTDTTRRCEELFPCLQNGHWVINNVVGAMIPMCEFVRLVCLRVHPTFSLLHPTESYVSFFSIDGSKHEIWPAFGEQFFEGDLRPNGEWMLVDKCLGLALINRFNVDQVYKCVIHWGTGDVNLELWSEDRPVSKQSPLRISHEYEVRQIP